MLALRTGRRPSVYWGYSQCVYMRAFFRHAKDIALRKSAIHIGPSSPGARNPARGRTPAMGGERQRQKRKEEKKALMVSGTFISRIITPKMWGIGDMVQVVTYIDQSSSQMFHSNAKKACFRMLDLYIYPIGTYFGCCTPPLKRYTKHWTCDIPILTGSFPGAQKWVKKEKKKGIECSCIA